jgi:lipoprotein-anchoring transpeptidase ErfK/SrfK
MTNETKDTLMRQTRQEARTLLRQIAFVLVVSASSLAQSQSAAAREVRARRQVLVSIPDRKLAVIENGKVLRTFNVSVGAEVSPSPIGKFEIVNRLANPTYYHSGVVIPAGKNNPLGPRWVGLDKQATEFTERARRVQSARQRRMVAFACTTGMWSSSRRW